MGAVWIEAEGETRVGVVDLLMPAPEMTALTSSTVGRRHGWPLPDLTAFVAVARLWSEACDQLAEDEASLRRTYGPRWPLVPRHHGTLATQAGEILATGIIPVAPEDADPVNLLHQLETFVGYTADTVQHLLAQTSILAEGLGSDLSGLTLGDLRRLSRALLRLAAVPPPNPAWCRPAAAHAASIALAAFGDDMRAAGAVHQDLYEEFTEDVWDLPAMRGDAAVDRWWQFAARRGLRTHLASASRTGRAPANVKATMATLRKASDLRGGIDGSWSSMRGHLGWFADARIPDVDGAAASLAAIQALHTALGERRNETKLAELAAADAFVSEELTGVADAIGDAVSAWVGLAKRFNGPDPLAFTASELSQWSIVTAQSLEVVRVLKETTAPLRPRARTVGELLDDAVMRDRVDQLRELLDRELVNVAEERGQP